MSGLKMGVAHWRAPTIERPGTPLELAALRRGRRRWGTTLAEPTIPTYLSHSYRSEDRALNRILFDRLWEAGFAPTVDPKSSDRLSIPHLELMMQRSACYVAFAPHRPDQKRYRTSPYIVFEHNMAVRARKPVLVIAEPQVAGHPFDRDHLAVFRPDDVFSEEQLRPLIDELRQQSLPLAQAGAGHVLGTVGLLLPAGRTYERVRDAIYAVLELAGYRVDSRRHDPAGPLDFAEIDGYDFIVGDIRSMDLMCALYGRFVPTIRLGHLTASGRTPPLPGMFREEALQVAGRSSHQVIWWRDEDDLVTQLQPLVDKMQRPRREFRTHEEGAGYFQSLGRTIQGPVFISNADEQNELARHLSRAFDLNNISFFHYRYGNSIPMGTVWAAQLFEHLRASKLFVPLMTADYWGSDLCKKELRLAERLARQRQIRIFPYLLDKTPVESDFAARLQGVDLTGMALEEQLRQVVADIEGYLTG